jgi:hypothetical protein
LTPGANAIKLLTVVFYCHFTVIPSFCGIKQYWHSKYYGMAVFSMVFDLIKSKYCEKLTQMAPGDNVINKPWLNYDITYLF